MATYEDYTEKTDSTFSNTYQHIGNDPSDATESGYWYISDSDYLKWLTSDTNGLNLDEMFDSLGNNILSTQKGAIISLTDSTGGTGTDTLTGYTISSLTDSTGGSTADAILGACTDTTATDQSGTINDNFAKVATALNAIASALNGDSDVSSLRDKIEEILLRLRPTSGHGLIS